MWYTPPTPTPRPTPPRLLAVTKAVSKPSPPLHEQHQMQQLSALIRDRFPVHTDKTIQD